MPRLRLLIALAALGLVLAGCSTPASRIGENRAAFDAYPPAAQEKIRAGRIDLGFTPDMVRMALGDPVRKITRTSAEGGAEVWVYDDTGPHFSFGFGVAGGSRHSAVGGGVAMSSEGYGPEERMRVEFKGGVVSAVDYAR